LKSVSTKEVNQHTMGYSLLRQTSVQIKEIFSCVNILIFKEKLGLDA